MAYFTSRVADHFFVSHPAVSRGEANDRQYLSFCVRFGFRSLSVCGIGHQ